MSSATQRSHAVVVGASMSGLLAARALTEHFARVAIVERDRLPDTASVRGGVPQSHHLHVMMPGGRLATESLLPGLESELVAAGAAVVRWPKDALWLTPAGWSRRFEGRGDHYMLCVSRPLLEWLVRRRVLESERVAVLEGCEVSDATRATVSRCSCSTAFRIPGGSGGTRYRR